MSFIILLFKAKNIEEKRQQYEDEKLNSIRIEGGRKPLLSLSQKYRHCKLRWKKRILSIFIPKFIRRCWLNLINEKSFLNYMWKSFLGFISGFILTYIFFLFFVFQLSLSLVTATIICSILGVYMTLGLAFSYRVRCLVLMILPQFFSNVGRYALIGYAFVLILSGPAKNTLHNVGVLTESMACGQEQLKAGVEQIKEAVKKPFLSMKDALENMVENVKRVANNVKESLLSVIRIVMNIVRVIQSAMSWLSSIVNVCNKSMGTPSERCHRALDNGVQDCKAKLGVYFSWLCNVTYVARVACEAAKAIDYMCLLVQFVSFAFLQNIKRKIRAFANHIHTMLYVDITVRRHWEFSGQSSKSASDIASSIAGELRDRSDRVLSVLTTLATFASPLLIFIVARAKYYQYMYEKSDRYDNRYITKQFVQLELARARGGRDTILPLNRRERGQYIRTTSLRLVAREKLNLARSMIFLAITTFKMLVHLVTDYSLFWILATIRRHAMNANLIPPRGKVEVVAAGGGWWGNAMQESVDSLLTATPKPSFTMHCLPDPSHPDYNRYIQIGVILTLLWLCALLEPYGLRMRHVFMDYYRPMRAMTRAQALYTRILNRRGGFLKYARRKLHREFKLEKEEKITFKDWLSSVIPCWWLRWLLGLDSGSRVRCLLCGAKESEEPLIHCPTPGCVGVYCTKCFADLKNLCTICLKPSQYGDISDVSEEKDSSDDDPSALKHQLNEDIESRFIAIHKNARASITKQSKKPTRYPAISFAKRLTWRHKDSIHDDDLRLNLLDVSPSSDDLDIKDNSNIEGTLAESTRRSEHGKSSKENWRKKRAQNDHKGVAKDIKGHKAARRVDGQVAWPANRAVHTIYRRATEANKENSKKTAEKCRQKENHEEEDKPKTLTNKYVKIHRRDKSTDSESYTEDFSNDKALKISNQDSLFSNGDFSTADTFSKKVFKSRRRLTIGDQKSPKSSPTSSTNNHSLQSTPKRKIYRPRKICDHSKTYQTYVLDKLKNGSSADDSQASCVSECSDFVTSDDKIMETKVKNSTKGRGNNDCDKLQFKRKKCQLNADIAVEVSSEEDCKNLPSTSKRRTPKTNKSDKIKKCKIPNRLQLSNLESNCNKNPKATVVKLLDEELLKNSTSSQVSSASESNKIVLEKCPCKSKKTNKSFKSGMYKCDYRKCGQGKYECVCRKENATDSEDKLYGKCVRTDRGQYRCVCRKSDQSSSDDKLVCECKVTKNGEVCCKCKKEKRANDNKNEDRCRSDSKKRQCLNKKPSKKCQRRKGLKKKVKTASPCDETLSLSDGSYFVKTALGDEKAMQMRNKEDAIGEEIYKLELGKADEPERCLRLDDVSAYLDSLAKKYGKNTRKFYVKSKEMRDKPKWLREYKWEDKVTLPSCLGPGNRCVCEAPPSSGDDAADESVLPKHTLATQAKKPPADTLIKNLDMAFEKERQSYATAPKCSRPSGSRSKSAISNKTKENEDGGEGIIGKILSPFKRIKNKMRKGGKADKCVLDEESNVAAAASLEKQDGCSISSLDDDDDDADDVSESTSNVNSSKSCTSSTKRPKCVIERPTPPLCKERTTRDCAAGSSKQCEVRTPVKPVQRQRNCDTGTCTYSTKSTATDNKVKRRVCIQEPSISSSTVDSDAKWEGLKQNFTEQMETIKKACKSVTTPVKCQKNV